MSDTPPTSLPRKILYALVLVLGGIVYGFFATTNHWWVADTIANIRASFQVVFAETRRPWFMSFPGVDEPVQIVDAEAMAPGLLMIAGVTNDRENFIRIIDRQGNVIQEVKPNWFDIWDAENERFPAIRRPQRMPGTLIHGLAILPDGDYVFNFEHLSTVRMNQCGEVVWKLDNLGHHFVNPADDGTLWVGAEKNVAEGDTGFPNLEAPMPLWRVQQISPDGEILRDIDVTSIFVKNDMLGMLHMATTDNDVTTVVGDTLHLNDADAFPADMESELFEPGDLLISLRNINTVLVVDGETLEIKFISTGQVLRQHDADFAEGDKIRVYDNRNLDPQTDPALLSTRIVELDARTGKSRVYFEGEGPAHVYSPTMGRQQLLPNGNLLLTAPRQGRALEVTPDGSLVWQFYNELTDEFAGMLTEAHLLPMEMDRAFFESRRANCGN